MNTFGSGRNKFDLVVQGDIVLSDRIIDGGFIGICNGKISGIFDSKACLEADEVISVEGNYILPGAIDGHVHSYSDPNEGFTAATSSAAAGGVTTIIDMPYDAGGPVISTDVFEAKRNLVEREALVDVALLATIKKEGGLDQIAPLAEAGACGFKVSLFETDPDRFPQICDHELLNAFRHVKETGLLIGIHAENNEIVTKETELWKMSNLPDHVAFAKSRPKVAEAEASLRAMELAYDTGVHLHIFHVSHPRIYSMIKWYQEQGATITGETCTHYLTFTEDDLAHLKGKGKINPPLRSMADREGLWDLCAANQVDMVTSDHAPWPLSKKVDENIFKCASGAPGVELLLPMLFSNGVATGRISIFDMVKLISESPARLFNISHRKGGIFPGADADLVIFDPKKKWTVEEEKQHSSAGWSPYNGLEITGSVYRTLVRGKIVYDDGSINAKPGFGTFIAPVNGSAV